MFRVFCALLRISPAWPAKFFLHDQCLSISHLNFSPRATNQSLLHCIKGFLQETLDDRTALLASSLQEVEQTLHEKSRSILKGELDLSSQIHKLADDILQLRGELKAFMSHAGYQPCVCNPLEGDPPDLDLGWVPLNKRPSVRYGVWPLLMLVR